MFRTLCVMYTTLCSNVVYCRDTLDSARHPNGVKEMECIVNFENGPSGSFPATVLASLGAAYALQRLVGHILWSQNRKNSLESLIFELSRTKKTT